MESLWWATLAGLMLLVWCAPAIPSQDGPSHLYNLQLLDDLWWGTSDWQLQHVLAPPFATNLGFLLFAWPLLQVLPLWAVERAILCLHLLLISSFARTWLSVTSRPHFPSLWIVFAFAFPWPLWMGFYSFQLACDFAMCGICLAWRWRSLPLPRVAPVLWLSGGALVVLHPGGACLFVALVVLLELTSMERTLAVRIGRSACLAAPILAVLWLAMNREQPPMPAPLTQIAWESPAYIGFMLLSFASVSFAAQGLMFVGVVGGFFVVCLPQRKTARHALDHRTRFCISAALSLVVLHILLPNAGLGGGFMTGRFIGWVPLLLLPMVDSSSGDFAGIPRRWIPGVVGVAGLASMLLALAPVSAELGEIQSAALRYPGEGIVAGVFFDRRASRTAMVEPLLHIDCFFAMPHGVLATNYQSDAPFFPIRTTALGARTFAMIGRQIAGGRNDWIHLGIDALVTIDATQGDRTRIERGFSSSWQRKDGRVELWRKRPAGR